MTISKEYREKPCPTCGAYTNRGPTTDAVIVRGGKVLLIKRGGEPYKGYWAVPGGYLVWDETFEQAITREVSEEVGLEVTSHNLIGVYSDPSRSPVQTISAAFVCEARGEPRVGDDAAEYSWFPLTSLPTDLAFDHRKIIDDYLKKVQPHQKVSVF